LADGLWASADFVARFVIAARSARSMKSEERLQLSLFTRLNTVEAELRVMKDSLAEMKVNQHELRRDRDEWRWRAERLLADQEGGAWWRWRKRGDAALDAAAASLSKLTVALRATLAETGRRPKRPAPARRCLATAIRTPHPRSEKNGTALTEL
jgi:hypothetical protein